MEHPQMNPTPTPNSTAPVDIARLRELLAKATPGHWFEHWFRSGIPASKADAKFIAAIRNEAPALLDELDRLRDTASRLRYYHEQKETENRQLYEEVSELETKLRRECETHSATSAERDKLREEVERLKGAPTPEIDMHQWFHDASAHPDRAKREMTGYHIPVDIALEIERKLSVTTIERDSLRQENEQLLKEIEELKANQKESQ